MSQIKKNIKMGYSRNDDGSRAIIESLLIDNSFDNNQ